jgi:hypothetical protein
MEITMILFPKKDNEQVDLPAVEFKLRLSEETVVRLAPYLVALFIGATGGGWILGQMQSRNSPVSQAEHLVLRSTTRP